jgi:hypothetical protein
MTVERMEGVDESTRSPGSPPRNRRYDSLPFRLVIGSITCISGADAPVTLEQICSQQVVGVIRIVVI